MYYSDEKSIPSESIFIKMTFVIPVVYHKVIFSCTVFTHGRKSSIHDKSHQFQKFVSTSHLCIGMNFMAFVIFFRIFDAALAIFMVRLSCYGSHFFWILPVKFELSRSSFLNIFHLSSTPVHNQAPCRCSDWSCGLAFRNKICK